MLPQPSLLNPPLNMCTILCAAIEHYRSQRAVLVFDAEANSRSFYRGLSPLFTRRANVTVDAQTSEAVLVAFAPLAVRRLIVLIQSSSFRLNEFRIRVELFKRGLKVIEHPHLGRMTGDQVSLLFRFTGLRS